MHTQFDAVDPSTLPYDTFYRVLASALLAPYPRVSFCAFTFYDGTLVSLRELTSTETEHTYAPQPIANFLA